MADAHGQNPSSLRTNNRRLVLNVVRDSGEVTISQIADRTHLSKTTIWKIVDHFVKTGLIVAVGKAEGNDELGKKPELFQFKESFGYVISITLYGSSILLGLTDAKASIYYKETVFISEDEPLDRVVGIISSFIRKWQDSAAPNLKKGSKLLGIVLASSGVVDGKLGLSYTASRFASWPTQAPIRDLIAEQVSLKAPFYIDNYNRYFAFAEKVLGCAKGKKNVVDVVAGYDGLGAGIIAEDRIKRGPRYLTGEIGHMCLNADDEETCHCGGRGCFEQLVSCERLIRKARAGRDAHADSAVYANPSTAISLETIFDAANNDDEWARRLMDGVVKWFAIGLHNVSVVFNPEIFVISGDYRKAGDYFLQQLTNEIEKVGLLRMNKQIEIRYGTFDEEGPVVGGAAYVLDDYFSNRLTY